ncbi:MAG: bacteriophage CI repressor [Ketobacter sp.]|nr:bacteriophage CI repressor [Ketobacter sp.]
MKIFDEQLLRLKTVLRVTSDKEVAALLGMSKAAFSDRKKRGAFPVDKVKALATDRPDLKINVQYIVSGGNPELARRLSAMRAASDVAQKVQEVDVRYEIQEAVFEELVGALSPPEQKLIGWYRSADDKGRRAIEATAKALARK